MTQLPILSGNGPLTMSSREIAELVESRHDSVKRTIERLAERGLISFTPSVETSHDGAGSRPVEVYCVGKRDSYVIVAQLSPEFTARLVDRWQELEAQQQRPQMPDLSDPVVLVQLLTEHASKRIEAEQRAASAEAKAEAMQEDVDALDRIAKADGSLSITEAAKSLGTRPKDVFTWLSRNGWIYKRPGGEAWLGYQSKCNSGLLEHKTTLVTRQDGSEKITEQVRVTAKGMAVLAKLMPQPFRLIA